MNISGVNTIDVNARKPPLAKKTLGKEDFMNLLLNQLSHQDPLNPMDSREFTVQLTQFSSLEELNNINDTLSDVLAFQHSMQNATVTNLIGKQVRVSGSNVYLDDQADIIYQLADDASSVKILIHDPTGRIIRTENIGPHKAGDGSFLWDGRDELGNRMSEGNYTFEIEALDSSGNPVEVETMSSGNVTGIVFRDGVTYLVLDKARNVRLSDIQAVEE
ncbi:MAG: hypothetical protein GXP46_02255 [Deferribacteres bacterium]|nr:hypothetical protein [Deferribacteres bacterium]